MYASSLVALSQQQVLRRTLDVIANNLANLSTPGFKKEFLLLKKQHKEIGPGADIAFVAEKGVGRDMEPGVIEPTQNPLDVVVQGTTFLAVQTPQGIGYTKNGSLTLDATGQLITQSGYPVLSNSYAPIVIPEKAGYIHIATDGMISTALGPVAPLGVFEFDQPEALEKVAGGIYQGDEAPRVSANPRVLQGVQELSNVQPITELTQMIDVLRNYQYNQNLIDKEEERQRQSIEKLVLAR